MLIVLHDFKTGLLVIMRIAEKSVAIEIIVEVSEIVLDIVAIAIIVIEVIVIVTIAIVKEIENEVLLVEDLVREVAKDEANNDAPILHLALLMRIGKSSNKPNGYVTFQMRDWTLISDIGNFDG